MSEMHDKNESTKPVCAACGADMVCSEHGFMPCDICGAEGAALSLLCSRCGNTEARVVSGAEFDPLICHACGKVYLHGDDDGLCDDPMCGGAHLEPLLGFVSYRRKYTSHRDPDEKNEVAVRIKERIEKVLHSQKIQGGFFIDKSGIEREDFAKKISSTIQACKGGILLLILTPGALDPRGNDDDDWMLNEIRLALQYGLEIIPVKASNFRKDDDFMFPAQLHEAIRPIQRKNVNLSFIGDLEEHYINDAIIRITNEVKQALGKNPQAAATRPKANARGSSVQVPARATSHSPAQEKTPEIRDAVAQYNLGVKYDNGQGVPKDHKEAVKWWRLAADQEHADAQFSLGVMYNNGGQGVPLDYKEAVKWFRLAADQGHADAQFSLGYAYLEGEGVPLDYKEAVKWFRLAADLGDAYAQFNLGNAYRKGKGVPQDHKEAAKWFRLAADQGVATAQFNLGKMYENGQGAVGCDYNEAVKWFRLAADQGNADAQSYLGWMYANGRGVPQNDKEAVKWYRLAADQGQADAQYNLGWMYKNGLGVAENLGEAEKWLQLAAKQGHGKASELLNEFDPLYNQAVEIVLKTRRPSISLVQRELDIGYNRTARLIEQMEAAGIVSAIQSNGNREVLVPDKKG